MSDTSPRNPSYVGQMMADALLRSVGGVSAQFVVTNAGAANPPSELGLVTTTFVDVVVSPVVMRKLRPTWQEGGQSKWELMVSGSSVAAQVNSMQLASAQALFAMTLSVVVNGQSYLIESVSANEAFGQVYLYRLLLREARQQSI